VLLLGTAGLALAYSTTKPSNSAPSLPSASVDLADLDRGGPPVVHIKELVNKHLQVVPGQVNGAFFKVPGKDMSVGLYSLDAGNSVSYVYRYPEFKYIVEGEWHLTDGTGQVVHAKAGDLMYFPMGTSVNFTVAKTGLGYYITDASTRGLDGEALKAAAALNPKMVHFPEIAKRSNTNQAIACDSKGPVTGLEMTAGLFALHPEGPALTRTYDHEEFGLVTIGEFDIEDGTGQHITVKAGDLVYLPKGSQIRAKPSKPSQVLWSDLRYVEGDSCNRGPPVVHFKELVNTDLPVVPGQVNGAFFKIPGKDLSVGLYSLDAGNSVSYTYQYPEFKYIVEGEWHLTDGTGQVVHAKAGDLMYFPMGTSVNFTVAKTGLSYYITYGCCSEASAMRLDGKKKAAAALNPSMVHFPEIAKRSNTNQAIACDSKVPGLEMTAGLFALHPEGPALTRTYDHEEFGLVTVGEFDIEDGTGQHITVKAGDLVYLAKGSQIRAKPSKPSQVLWSDLHYVEGDSCGTSV